MDRNKKKSDDRKPPVVNVVEGDVLGVLVQAGVVYGGVHVHHRGAGPVPVVTPVVPLEAVPPELFVGRSSQVEDLLAKWSPEVRPPTNVSVVAGMGGVGKTVLVRHTSAVAVQRGWFSGGALLVDMQGYKPAGDRVEAAEMFAPLLRALGVGGKEIPDTESEQATVYHQLLGLLARQQRRVLLVLDNVSTVDQIRGLLPSHAVHHVVVTTRDTLPLPGTRTLELDVLPVEDACELLRQTLNGDVRLSEVPGAAEHLVQLCGHLPLAVVIVGAVLAEDTTLTAAELIAELSDATTRLATLEQGASAVGTAFDVSWRRVIARDPPTAGLLKLLTLNPGPGVSTDAAAALLGQPLAAVRPRLRALRRTHLLQLTDGHWQLHDLIRLYVRDRRMPKQTDEDGGPATAVTRLLEHYRQAAQHTDANEACAWFTRERPNLLAAVPLAAAVGRSDITVDLAESVVTKFLTERYELDTRIILVHQAVGAAEQLGDPARHTKVLLWLGRLLKTAGRLPEAIEVCRRAHEVSLTTGDPAEEAEALLVLGVALFHDQQSEQAVTAYRQALALCRAGHDREIEYRVVGYLGDALSTLRQYDEAISVLQRAITIARSCGDRSIEGSLLTALGAVFARAGRAAEAFDTLELAAEVCHAAGDQEFEAQAWTNLALLHAQLGQRSKLATAHRKALAIYQAIGDKDSESVLLVNVGVALTQLGGLARGTAAFQEAVTVCRAAGDKNAEGEALFRLGSFLMDGLQFSAACTAHQKAVDIWRDIGNRHREGIELNALARALLAAGRRAAAQKAAAEAIEGLLDSGDLARAAAAQEWIDKGPKTTPEVSEPEEPTASTVTTQEQAPGCGGCYTVLTVVAVPFLHYFGGSWWILVGWAVLAPFLQSMWMVGLPVDMRKADVSTPELVRAIRFAKGCMVVVLTLVAALAFSLGGPWWLLAFCTVLAVIGINGKARLPLYTVIGGLTAYYMWGTWWVLLGLLIPVLGMLSWTKPTGRPTTRIDVG